MELQEVKKPVDVKTSSVKEVANFMGISYITLFRMVKCGKIKAINKAKTGHKPIYGITPEAVQEYYDQIPDTTQGDKSINE
jgi:hypothetical protein